MKTGTALVLGLLWGGCAAHSTPRRPENAPKFFPVVGTPSDFKTRPGTYEGYNVIACWDHACTGIIGSGSRWPPGMEREPGYSDATYQASFQTFRADLVSALKAEVTSYDTSGLSRRCGSTADGIETVVWMHNWRELDVAVRAAGQFLNRCQLKERISICVSAHSEDELL